MPSSVHATTAENRVAVETHLQVARITLVRPPLNVIDFQLMDELLAALKQLEQRNDVSVVIINGGERAFSAGVDVAVHTPDKVQTMLQKFHGVILALTRFSHLKSMRAKSLRILITASMRLRGLFVDGELV